MHGATKLILPKLLGIGSGGGPPLPARVAGNNKVAIIGDSRSAWMASPLGQYNSRYPMTAARQIIKGKLHSDTTHTFQTGGYTVQQIQETHYPSAVATDAKTCVCLGGVNDLGSNPSAVAARIQAMADDWTSRGSDYVFLVCNEVPPDAGWVGNITGHRQLHDLIDAMENKPSGIYVADTWLGVTGDDSNTPLAGTYQTSDTVHFATMGAYWAGAAIADTLNEALPAFDLLGGTVPDLSQVLSVGTLASNDLATNRSGAAGTYVGDVVTFEGAPWVRFVATGADGGGNLYRSSSTVPGGFVAGTTKVQSVLEYVLLDGHQNIRNFVMAPYKQSGTSLNAAIAGGSGAGDGAHSGSGLEAAIGSFPPGEHRGFLWTPVALYDAAATQFRPWWFSLVARSSGNMNATIMLRNFQCRVIL